MNLTKYFEDYSFPYYVRFQETTVRNEIDSYIGNSFQDFPDHLKDSSVLDLLKCYHLIFDKIVSLDPDLQNLFQDYHDNKIQLNAPHSPVTVYAKRFISDYYLLLLKQGIKVQLDKMVSLPNGSVYFYWKTNTVYLGLVYNLDNSITYSGHLVFDPNTTISGTSISVYKEFDQSLFDFMKNLKIPDSIEHFNFV